MAFIDFSMVFIGYSMVSIDFLYSQSIRFSMTEYLELPQILYNMDQRKGPQFFPNSVSWQGLQPRIAPVCTGAGTFNEVPEKVPKVPEKV